MTSPNDNYRLMTVGVFTTCMALIATVCWPSFVIGSEVIRAGIIGCDTSHSLAFSKILNSPDAGNSFANVRVVAAFPGGSEDIASSRDRVGKFSEELRGMEIVIVDSIELLLEQVDVEGFDGYEPLVGQIAQFFQTGKPPVTAEETLDIFAFMEAADESKRQGGVSVTLKSVLAKARAEVASRK